VAQVWAGGLRLHLEQEVPGDCSEPSSSTWLMQVGKTLRMAGLHF
jgi:hypothetical protein